MATDHLTASIPAHFAVTEFLHVVHVTQTLCIFLVSSL